MNVTGSAPLSGKKKNTEAGSYPLRTAALIGFAAVISLVLQHGFPTGNTYRALFNWFDLGLAVTFVGAAIGALRHKGSRRKILDEFRFEYLITGLFVISFLLTWVSLQQNLSR